MSEWDIASAAVSEHAEQLRHMTTHSEIYGWAKDNDLTTRTLFPKIKAQLHKQLGIDYDQLRQTTNGHRAEQMAAEAVDAPEIVLWAAADDDAGTFALTDVEGTALWYSTFHGQDKLYNPGDQASASTSAAEKAVYLAGQARREADLEVVRLTVRVSDHRVDGEAITKAGLQARAVVTIDVTDEDNPALEWCRAPGFRNWREIDLSALLSTELHP